MRRLHCAVLFLVLSLAAGCTLGPDPERPHTAADEAGSFANAPLVEVSQEVDLSPWWKRFGDEVTVDLVELALAENTDLRVAVARVIEAEASLRSANSTLWPQIDYSASASKSETAFNLPGQGLISVDATNYTASLGLSYQIDLFGKLKRSRQSAWASLLAQEAAAETVMHSVVAAVVRARVQVATLERSLAVAKDIRTSWGQTLEIVERRYRSGLVRAMDLHLARENYASVEGAVLQLEAGLAKSRHSLDVLVGRRPASSAALPDTLPDLPDLEPVPAGLPVDLLDRRPDLRGSELQLQASTYGVGIAIADLYPNLSLSASYGTKTDSISDILDLDRAVYQLIGNLVGPLFNGGARRAEVKAAKARLEAASATYAGAVLRALREVEDALVSDHANLERLKHAKRRLAEARAADRLARDRYQRGVEKLLTVLETERRVRAAEDAFMTTQADVWNTRIDLFLALGGDWSDPEQLNAAESTQTAESVTIENEVS